MFLFYLKLPDWASFSILVDVSLLITFVAAEFDVFRDRWLWPLMSVLVGVFGLLTSKLSVVLKLLTSRFEVGVFGLLTS